MCSGFPTGTLYQYRRFPFSAEVDTEGGRFYGAFGGLDRVRRRVSISTAFVESAVNETLSKRMIKKQQMRWNTNLAPEPTPGNPQQKYAARHGVFEPPCHLICRCPFKCSGAMNIRPFGNFSKIRLGLTEAIG